MAAGSVPSHAPGRRPGRVGEGPRHRQRRAHRVRGGGVLRPPRASTSHGVDNNMRADFFGPGGDTTWNRQRLEADVRALHAPRRRHPRPRRRSTTCSRRARYELVIHAAAQPSHDLAASRPFDDFDVNAVGTLNLLEAARRHAPEAVFITVSTNKVYGDNPNRVPLVELETRWDYADPAIAEGIDETMSLDHCLHSRVRRVQGGRRRAHPGVRPLLRAAHRHLPRRLPHRPAPLRRRAARLPQLPRAHRAARGRRTRSSATRGSRSATRSTRPT